MKVTSKNYRKILKVIELLHEHTNELEMRTHIAKPILDLIGGDHFASFRWDESQKTYGQSVFLNMDASNIGRYSEYYQFRDPITPKLAQRRHATLVEDVMSHANLRKTEFFNDFLLADGLCYGVNLHLYANERNIGDLRIWRSRHHGAFDHSSCEILDILKPHFIQAIQNIHHLHNRDNPAFPIEEQCIKLRHKFLLTGREAQVVKLVLDGERDDMISRKLCISITTVRSHVKNIFSKTGINNRGKLHSLVN